MTKLFGTLQNNRGRHYGEIKSHDEGRRKAGIILMARIKYQEAAGQELKESRQSIWRECFIRAELPEQRQLNLDEGRNVNEFYNLTKRR